MGNASVLLNVSRRIVERFQDCSPMLSAYNSAADFDWIQHQSKLPWMELPIQVPTDDIYSEIISITPYLVDHRDDYGEHHGWKSFCIHGKSYDATREDLHYQDARPHVWTMEAVKHMPRTVEFFKDQWPASSYQRIRVMSLAPGGYITVHSDSQHSSLQPINISITQPDQCRFVMEKHGTIPFSPGRSFWLDVSNRHAVFNDSDQYRWHIIVHQKCDHPIFQRTVVEHYHSVYNTKHATSPTNNPR